VIDGAGPGVDRRGMSGIAPTSAPRRPSLPAVAPPSSPHPVVDWLTRQQWLEPVERTLQDGVRTALRPAGAGVAKALHGTWLGHPLHAVVTDVPVGAWTVALVCDLAGNGSRRAASAARGAIAVGLAGAVAAAVTGVTDWHVVGGRRRRIGVVHGLLNSTAAALYASSFALRRNGRAGAAARATAAAGYVVMAASAYLGGHLVYEERMGVDHAGRAREALPDDFTAVLADEALPEGGSRRVEAGGVPLLLVRQEQRVHALVETCAHLGGPLAEGAIGPGTVRCPWHGSTFALDDGRVVEGPAVHRQPCLETRVRDGQIEVRRRS
jgi:nitrite reductase/ring-hydroxylating ferredoxin subunit/uncharacterized membrane protein